MTYPLQFEIGEKIAKINATTGGLVNEHTVTGLPVDTTGSYDMQQVELTSEDGVVVVMYAVDLTNEIRGGYSVREDR